MDKQYDNDETAFAVYSNEDKSLTFYADDKVPEAGSSYNGKDVSNVYTGFETEEYIRCKDVPWHEHHSDISSVKMDESFKDIQPVSTACWFKDCNLTDIDAKYLDTSKVKNMRGMFHCCYSLTNIETLADWNTGNVKDMYGMFHGCHKLSNIDALRGWDVSNVEDMGDMFQICYNLADIDSLTDWNTGNVKDMSNIFAYCSNLANIDALANWDVSNVETMRQMFFRCSNLTNIDALANWDISNVENMLEMFTDCDKLSDSDKDKFFHKDDERKQTHHKSKSRGM